MLELTTLEVNDTVALVKFVGWAPVSEGAYTVHQKTSDELVVINTAGEQRVFCMLTGLEKGSDDDVYFESIEDMQARQLA